MLPLTIRDHSPMDDYNCGASLSFKNGCWCIYCNTGPDLSDFDWVIDEYNIL